MTRMGNRGAWWLVATGAQLVLLAGLTGCPTPTDNTGDNSNTNASTDTGNDLNGTFETASEITIDSEGKADLTSRLSADELDIYKLGAFQVGDRVQIDIQATSGDLDPTAALFDEAETLVAFNDDRDQDSNTLNLNPLVDTRIAEAGHTYFLGVTPFPGGGSSGSYRIRVTVTHPSDSVTGTPQVVYFDWRGGNNIDVPNVGSFDLPVFDASDVGLPSSQTEALKDRIQQFVEARFVHVNLTIRSSDDGAPPAEDHTTVIFGGFNRSAFAISEKIDDGNKDPGDVTIVFAESFNGAFSLAPTLERIATAMGNTTAHELGHLLGLVHTVDCDDLMDTTCGNDSILVTQEFSRAQIDDSVFPVGFQDSAEILAWVLGLSGN